MSDKQPLKVLKYRKVTNRGVRCRTITITSEFVVELADVPSMKDGRALGLDPKGAPSFVVAPKRHSFETLEEAEKLAAMWESECDGENWKRIPDNEEC